MKVNETDIKKKGYPLGDWILIVSTFFCAWLIIFPVLMEYFASPSISECSYFETDAQNTLASLASYFSESENNEVPNLQDLMITEDLILHDGSTVIIDGPKGEIRVRVINKKEKCPRGNTYEVYMGGTAGEWYSE